MLSHSVEVVVLYVAWSMYCCHTALICNLPLVYASLSLPHPDRNRQYAMADVSYSSITPSSASYASSVFPVLDASTSDLVDSIVARVAAGASDWKPVLEAYKEEFDARRLDGETDTVVYGLLLRLGMERGTDWRSKWANVKRQQQQQQQHEVAKTPRAPPVDIAKPDVFRRLHDDSAKTPLPSIKQQHGRLPQALTREALDKLQSTSSPYKKSYNTPAAARYAFNDYAAVTPRVHFASSMHEQQSPMTRYDQVIDQPRVNPASTSEGKEAMMHQAIRFDRLVLLGRMMDDWLSRIAVLQKLDIHTELARNALLARRSIHLWQDRVVRHRDLLETAERARQAAVKRSSLNLWREKAEKKQKARWEKQMHLAYRTVARKQEKQLKEAVLSVRVASKPRSPGSLPMVLYSTGSSISWTQDAPNSGKPAYFAILWLIGFLDRRI